MKKRIKFFVMDVDGTLTDGKIYMGENGEIMKAFDIKDGYAIHDLLPENEILPVIITGRESNFLKNRCTELGIVEVYQNIRDKIKQLEQILSAKQCSAQVDYSVVAYIGDDLNDLPCMNLIKLSGGLIGCPNDAILAVKKNADFISSHNGGNGAVREFVEWIIEKESLL